MIGYLEGKIICFEADVCLVQVGSVGYEVTILTTMRERLSPGDAIQLFTHAVIKEDDQSLFGFQSLKQRQWFRLLITAQGVGPKLAMMVLSSLPESRLVQGIEQKDASIFKAVKGVGPRLAEKLVVDLGPKLKKANFPCLIATHASSLEDSTSSEITRVFHDARLALESLGYKGDAVEEKLRGLCKSGVSVQEVIKQALALLAKIDA